MPDVTQCPKPEHPEEKQQTEDVHHQKMATS